jgi:site-specific recombinase XerD
MNQTVTDTLNTWRQQSEDTASAALIFPSPKKKGALMVSIKRSWETLLKAAQIKNFRWHDLRHDFASQLVMQGADLNVVRELLGHSDMKMTLRYAHLAPENKLRAVELLDAEK